jgi:chemotaxis protein MotB
MDERWLVSFADMMTLMFALFMVLFSISSVNTSKFEELQKSMQDAFSGKIMPGGEATMASGASDQSEMAAPQPPLPAIMPLDAVNDTRPGQKAQDDSDAAKTEQEDFKRLKQRIDQLAKQAGLEGKVNTAIRQRGLVVQLLTDDVFFDSGQAQLKSASLSILGQIGRVIRDERNHPIVVEGYTDSQPITTGQYPSNWELSGARAGAVIRQFGAVGIHARRMSLSGYAQQHPTDTNSTPEGRARNRRVEIVLSRLNRD